MKKLNTKLLAIKLKKNFFSIHKQIIFLFIFSPLVITKVFAITYPVSDTASLQNAISDANSVPGSIIFQNSITLTGPLPAITNNYTIEGNNYTLNGSSSHRGFIILGSGISPTIQNLTISNTLAKGGDGGNNFQKDGGSGGGGLGAGGAIFVGNGALANLSNITYTSNNATGGSSPDPTTTAAGNSGGGGGGGLGGNGGDSPGTDGGGGGGTLENQNASGSTGSGTGGTGAQSPSTDALAGGYGGGGGGAANTASTTASAAGGFGGGGGGGAGNLGNANGSNGGFGAGGGGGGADTGIAGGTDFGGGSAQNGATGQGGRGGGGAALGGSIFIDSASTAIISASTYPFTTTNTLTAGTGYNTPTAPSTLGNHIFIASGGTLQINASGTFTLTQSIESDSINSTGGIQIDQGGTVDLSGPSNLTNTFRGNLTIVNGTVKYDSVNSLGNGTGIIFPSTGAASTKILDNTTTTPTHIDLSNPIQMNGEGTIQGSGFASSTWRLRITSPITGTSTITIKERRAVQPTVASPSFSGGWIIDGENTAGYGRLLFNNPDTLGTGTIQIKNGGELRNLDSNNDVLSNNIEVTGNAKISYKAQNRVLTLSGNISDGSSPGNITFTQYSSPDNTGKCILTGSNTYTGTTTILSGTVNSNTASSISSSSAITLTSPGQLQINNVSQTIKNLSGDGNLILNQGATNTLTVNQTTDLTHSGDISGAGKFEKAGSGNLTFTTAKTYTGETILTAGTLTFDGSVADIIKTSSSVTINGGVLDILTTSADQQINELSGSGGTIDINDKTLTINNATTAGTFSGVIKNTTPPGNIIKTGANTLVLNGANTYSGTTVINAGTLTLSSTGDISSSSSVTLNNGSSLTLKLESSSYSKMIKTLSDDGSGTFIDLNQNTLEINQANIGTYSGIISSTGGGGNVTKSGNSSLTFASTNTYQGTTTINAGTLTLTSSGSITNSSLEVNGGTFNIETGAGDKTIQSLSGTGGQIQTNDNALTITQKAAGIYSGVISGSGNISSVSIIKEGTAALSLNANNTYIGKTLINAGVLELQASGDISSSASVTVANAAQLKISSGSKTINNLSGAGILALDNTSNTLTLNQATDLTMSGIISGSGNLEKTGSANLSLEGANVFTGTTTISNGTLTLKDNGDISTSSAVTLNTTGNLAIVTTTLPLSKTIQTLSGSGNINLNENNLTIFQLSSLTYSGIISGTGNLNINGPIQFGAASKHLYSGTTTINSGSLDLSTAGSSIEDSAELILSNSTFSISGGNKSINSLSGSGNIDLQFNILTINQTTDKTYSGTFTNPASPEGIIKNGTGNLTLAGTNSFFTGKIVINAGSVILNDLGSIESAQLEINSPGIFALETTASTTKMIQSLLTCNGNIQLNNNSLTINQGSVETYSGIISGSGNITKAGTSNLTFNNAQTYTGSTTISSGSLILNTANAISSSSEIALTSSSSVLSINIGNQNINTLNGTLGSSISLNTNNLKIIQNSDKTFAGVISGIGSIEKAGSSKLTFTNAQTYTGSTTISAGTLELSQSADISSSSAVQINTSGASLDIASSAGSKTIKNLSGASASVININNNDLTIEQSTNQTYSGVITSSGGGIIKSSSANLTLGGINTFTGQMTIIGGKLIINDNGSISNASSLTINSSGVFAIETTTSATKSIKTLSGTGTSDGNIELNDNFLTINQEANSSYAGIISGSGGITKDGTATLTLKGANSYTGSTTITNGKLSINSTGAIDSSSNVIITNPGILEANNGAFVKSFRNLQGTGNLNFPIDSTIVISINTSTAYSGNIQGSSSNGTIVLQSGSSSNLFTLSGTNTFKKMIINGATLSISSNGNLQVQSVELLEGNFKATETFILASNFDISTAPSKAIEVLSDKTLTLSGPITLSSNISKRGTGTLSITSSNTGNTGTTTIAEGKMLLKPSSRWSSTSFNINSGAKLAGSGTVEAAITNTGTISPGESIATLTIDGSYTENGTLEIEITSTDSDKINVIGTPGTATLNPSSILSVMPLSDIEFFKEGTEYVIITATNGVSGTFGSVINSDPKLIFDIRYESNRVVLIMKDNLLILPTNSITNPNAKAVAKYLEGCDFTNPDYINILLSLSSLDLQDLTDALLQISPARFGALQLTNYTNDQTVSKILTDRLRKLYRCNKACKDNRSYCIKPKSFEFWLEPFSYFIHQRDLEKQRPFKNKVFGSMMGSDFNFSNNINFGGAGGYSFADIDWKDNLGYAKIHSIYGSLYASRYNSFGFINASIVATANFYKIKRKIHFADVERKAKSKHNGFDITAHLGGGLDFLMADNFYFQPTVDIDYTYVWNDNFKERAADSLNLIVDTSNFSRIKSVALLNFIKDIKLKNLCLSPSIKTGYSYEDELSNAKITSKLEAVQCTKNKFTIKTFNKNHSRGIVGANITGTKTDGFTFYLNYQFEFGCKFHQHLATARFEWNF